MQLTCDEQRVLRFLFDRPQASSSREELQREFLSRMNSDLGDVLKSLEGEGLIWVGAKVVSLTEKAWRISDRIPRTPLRELVIPSR
jgi:hypothetical protein